MIGLGAMAVPVSSTQATCVSSTHTGGAEERSALELRMTRRFEPPTFTLTSREKPGDCGLSTHITRLPSGEKRGHRCACVE